MLLVKMKRGTIRFMILKRNNGTIYIVPSK